MATTKYTVTINTEGYKPLVAIVTYVGGRLKKWEHKKGDFRLTTPQLAYMVAVAREDQIDEVAGRYKGSIIYEKIEKQNKHSLFGIFNGKYFEFYQHHAGFEPSFDATAGKSLKSIINKITKLTSTENEAATVWSSLLDKWHLQEEFYRKQIELKQMNSNLNTLLRQLKSHGNSQAAGTTHQQSAREKL